MMKRKSISVIGLVGALLLTSVVGIAGVGCTDSRGDNSGGIPLEDIFPTAQEPCVALPEGRREVDEEAVADGCTRKENDERCRLREDEVTCTEDEGCVWSIIYNMCNVRPADTASGGAPADGVQFTPPIMQAPE